MTDTDTERIRANIEQTRAELGSDVDALSDKVTPSKVLHRQTDKVKDALGSVKDKVMGAASDARSSVGGTTGDTAHQVADKAKGNPLAVGVIAFGIGLLASSLIPASEKEKELGANVKDAAQPMVHKAADAAKEVADNLREPAQQAAASLKDSATSAASDVKSEASSAAGDVKNQASEAKHSVQSS